MCCGYSGVHFFPSEDIGRDLFVGFPWPSSCEKGNDGTRRGGCGRCDSEREKRTPLQPQRLCGGVFKKSCEF